MWSQSKLRRPPLHPRPKVIFNTVSSVALPLCMDRLVSSLVALIVSSTAIVLFGEIVPQVGRPTALFCCHPCLSRCTHACWCLQMLGVDPSASQVRGLKCAPKYSIIAQTPASN